MKRKRVCRESKKHVQQISSTMAFEGLYQRRYRRFEITRGQHSLLFYDDEMGDVVGMMVTLATFYLRKVFLL